jgi:hypothetical protein
LMRRRGMRKRVLTAGVCTSADYGLRVCMRACVQPGEDPFTRMAMEKKERVRAQGKRELANQKASMKVHGPQVVPSSLKLAAALPEAGKKARPTKRKELVGDVSDAQSLGRRGS